MNAAQAEALIREWVEYPDRSISMDQWEVLQAICTLMIDRQAPPSKPFDWGDEGAMETFS